MRSVGLAVLSVAFVMLWSSGWTASWFVVGHTSAQSILAVRYLIVLAVLVFLVTTLRQWKHVTPGTIAIHLLVGVLCHALYLLMSMSAFEHGVSAPSVAFINSLQPLLTACFAGSITGELSDSRQRKGLFIGLTSAALIVSQSYQSGVSALALILPFIAVLSLTIGTLLNKRHALSTISMQKPAPPLCLLLLIQTAGALLLILPMAAMNNNLQTSFSGSQWLAIIWLSLAVSLGAYALLQTLIRHLSIVKVTTLAYMIPPATMLQSYLMFNDGLSGSDAVALCFAICAVYMVATGRKSATDPTATNSSAGTLHGGACVVKT